MQSCGMKKRLQSRQTAEGIVQLKLDMPIVLATVLVTLVIQHGEWTVMTMDFRILGILIVTTEEIPATEAVINLLEHL